MPEPTPNDSRPDIRPFEEELKAVNPYPEPPPSGRRLDDVSFHDFAFYEYLFPTETGFGGKIELSGYALAYLDRLQSQGVEQQYLDYIAGYLLTLEKAIRLGTYLQQDPALISGLIRIILDSLYNRYPNVLLNYFAYYREFPELADQIFGRLSHVLTEVLWSPGMIEHGIPYIDQGVFNWDLFASRFQTSISPFFNAVNPINHAAWKDTAGPDLYENEYDFEIFPLLSVNVGLRLVYRQDWKPLAAQKGEIVRTIPLGPGQKERVTTKIVRRRKTTSSMESRAEMETTAESTDSTKDSSEIVRETMASSNWKEDLHAGGTFFGIGASSDTSVGENNEEKSRATSSHLSEAMQKTASKIRRETKVVVTTESEESFERENFSEIYNPNNEVAITYEYYRQQQQYEVFTRFAEVQSVIYVAERLPSPAEVDADWVRRHDWIIAKILKDESYRAALNELIHDVEKEEDPLGAANDPADAANNPFRKMLGSANDQFAKFTSNGAGPGQGGLTVPDIYAEPQRIYQEHLRETTARRRANELRGVKRRRLFRHIRDNILYYCQAIWAHEDSQQRILRYKKEGRRVPVEWQGPLFQQSGAQAPVSRHTPTGRTAPLWALIDATGPIGYTGNYAVFGLQPLPAENPDRKSGALIAALAGGGTIPLSLGDILSEMRSSYERNGELYDPALDAFAEEARKKSPQDLRRIKDHEVEDLAGWFPNLAEELIANGRVRRDAATGDLSHQLTTEDWQRYLHRKNSTRRFLVDSNNLYLSIRTDTEGAALEPFKRAHRYLDVMKALEDLEGVRLKNQRRGQHLQQPGEYDPDIDKVIIVGDGGDTLAARHAALHAAMGTPPPASVPAVPAPPP